jgi:hypothetical protein
MPQTVNIAGFGRVQFPDGMSPEQIQAAIETEILPKRRTQPAAAPMSREEPSFLERVGHGAQRGVDRLTQIAIAGGEKLGLKGFRPGLGDTFTEMVNQEEARYQHDRGPDAGADVASALGNIGIASPLALMPGGKTALTRAALGALSGGLGAGGFTFDPSNSLEGTAKNTATGAAAGAILAPIVGAAGDKLTQLVGRFAARLKGVAGQAAGKTAPAEILKEVPEFADLPPDLQTRMITEAQEQFAKFGRLDADALARKANLLANDVTPTTSMVTRDAGAWTRERNLQKLVQSTDPELASVGQALTRVYEANNAALAGRLQGMSKGLPAGSQEAHGMAVMRAVDELADLSQDKVGKIYEAVRQAKGGELASDARNLADALEGLRDNAYAEKLVASVGNRLKRLGIMDGDGALTAKTLTVDQAEELRKFVNKLPNDFGKRDIIRAIDADVLAGFGEDAFGGARAAASERFAMLENPATQRALNTLGELGQGKTAQNFIKSQVVDAADQDVMSLIVTLSRLPPEQGSKAIASLRAGVLQHLQAKAINPNSGQFSGAALNRAMQEMGETKLASILEPAKLAELKSLARAALDATYAPPFSAVNSSNTAPMLLSMTERARAIPGVPLLVSETAEKLAARSGYRGQLANAMAAQAGAKPVASAQARRLARLLTQMSPQAGNAALNERRKAAD